MSQRTWKSTLVRISVGGLVLHTGFGGFGFGNGCVQNSDVFTFYQAVVFRKQVVNTQYLAAVAQGNCDHFNRIVFKEGTAGKLAATFQIAECINLTTLGRLTAQAAIDTDELFLSHHFRIQAAAGDKLHVAVIG